MARTALSEWLGLRPSQLRSIPEEAAEALLALREGYQLAVTQTADQRRRNREMAALVRALQALVRLDHETGVANRRAFEERLEEEWQRSRRYRSPFSVIALDVDDLKQINDRHGHACGDLALKAVAGTLAKRVRAQDLVARVGGDEFMVLCPETDFRSVRVVAEKLGRNLEAITVIPPGGGQPVRVAASMGTATAGVHPSSDNLLREADQRLYLAKQLRHHRDVAAISNWGSQQMTAAGD
ncbi:MAG TPA: GGDEF domain-containing protein [Candidatus Dormibacteraeota bacterium]|nr:GGDEF domain-containing protein [Candidatus Dormibacteraeota bacterium]